MEKSGLRYDYYCRHVCFSAKRCDVTLHEGYILVEDHAFKECVPMYAPLCQRVLLTYTAEERTYNLACIEFENYDNHRICKITPDIIDSDNKLEIIKNKLEEIGFTVRI